MAMNIMYYFLPGIYFRYLLVSQDAVVDLKIIDMTLTTMTSTRVVAIVSQLHLIQTVKFWQGRSRGFRTLEFSIHVEADFF